MPASRQICIITVSKNYLPGLLAPWLIYPRTLDDLPPLYNFCFVFFLQKCNIELRILAMHNIN